MMALVRYEAGVHACGFHKSLTHDKTNRFTFEQDDCPVCAGSAQFARMQQEADEADLEALKREHGGKVPPTVPEPGEGRSTYVRMLAPDEPLPQKRGGARGY